MALVFEARDVLAQADRHAGRGPQDPHGGLTKDVAQVLGLARPSIADQAACCPGEFVTGADRLSYRRYVTMS